VNILAIDTAAEVLSVALRTDSGVLESTDTSGYRHSERLVPFIQRLLGEAGMSFGDLSLIVCSRGPGSFTGLRIGAATAKGISLGLGVPIVSVPTLDAYAWPFRPFPGTVVPLIDAKKRRFYTAFYRAGVRESEYLDAAPQDILSLLPADERVLFTGPGSALLEGQVKIDTSLFLFDPLPFAGRGMALLTLGAEQYEREGPDPDSTGPVYVRPSEAEITRNG